MMEGTHENSTLYIYRVILRHPDVVLRLFDVEVAKRVTSSTQGSFRCARKDDESASRAVLLLKNPQRGGENYITLKRGWPLKG